MNKYNYHLKYKQVGTWDLLHPISTLISVVLHWEGTCTCDGGLVLRVLLYVPEIETIAGEGSRDGTQGAEPLRWVAS